MTTKPVRPHPCPIQRSARTLQQDKEWLHPLDGGSHGPVPLGPQAPWSPGVVGLLCAGLCPVLAPS